MRLFYPFTAGPLGSWLSSHGSPQDHVHFGCFQMPLFSPICLHKPSPPPYLGAVMSFLFFILLSALMGSATILHAPVLCHAVEGILYNTFQSLGILAVRQVTRNSS